MQFASSLLPSLMHFIKSHYCTTKQNVKSKYAFCVNFAYFIARQKIGDIPIILPFQTLNLQGRYGQILELFHPLQLFQQYVTKQIVHSIDVHLHTVKEAVTAKQVNVLVFVIKATFNSEFTSSTRTKESRMLLFVAQSSY